MLKTRLRDFLLTKDDWLLQFLIISVPMDRATLRYVPMKPEIRSWYKNMISVL